MRLKNTIPLILVSALLGSCVFYSGPEEEVQLTRLASLGDMAGVYDNEGDPEGYLSWYFFGYDPIGNSAENAQIEHDAIERIQLSRIDNGLDVKALGQDCLLAERQLLEGEELELDDGHVVIDQEAYLLTRGAGDVALGPSTSKTILSIDVNGNLIWRRQDYAAGLLFVIFPMALSDRSEKRFQRLDIVPKEFYEKCNSQISPTPIGG
ncbi:MAG: hypothetical protein V2I26_12025 [Halieaceae bacterium]|jgi:hypothetical protein|nr:hypothetical protein [Halieaceae bacterium]